MYISTPWYDNCLVKKKQFRIASVHQPYAHANILCMCVVISSVCMNVYTYVCVYTQLYLHVCVCIYIHVLICMYIYVYIYICIKM